MKHLKITLTGLVLIVGAIVIIGGILIFITHLANLFPWSLSFLVLMIFSYIIGLVYYAD